MPANYVLLERITLTSAAASVVLDNIPQTGYTDLVLKISARVNFAGDWVGLLGQFNSSSSNYFYRRLYAYSGNTVAADSAASFGMGTGTSTPTGTFGSTELYIANYNSTSINKSFNIDGTSVDDSSAMLELLASGLWADNSAITSITITNDVSANFMSGSSFSLYGVAALGTTPVIAPKASGGDIVVSDGTYWYHAFLNTSAFIPSQNLTCDVLVIAGGGGGGGSGPSGATRGGAGAGAGGLLAFASQLLSPSNYSVTVGAGGSALSNFGNGTQGNNSQFASLTASVGGGFGASQSPNTGGNGGSGGGGGNGNGTGGTATSGQGFNGSVGGPVSGNFVGGAGGGAGAVGSAPANDTSAGNGGAGLNTYSSWATATGTGVSGFYAGGGGGGTWQGGTRGNGGSGGGGAGGAVSGNNPGVAGVANTGSGGGGGSYQSSLTAGGNGGSGIVIVRYTVA